MTCKMIGRDPINVCPSCTVDAYRHIGGETARDRVVAAYNYAVHHAVADHLCQYSHCEWRHEANA